MTKLRRILLKGIDSDEKLDIVSRYARMLVEQGKRDPKVRDLAVAVTVRCKSKDHLCEAKTLHSHVRDKIRYVKDIANVERFATPKRTLFMEKAGDCDDSSIALSALLESIGHETRLILIDPDLSGRFTHVIAQVRIGNSWHWMETTKKMQFGWAPKFTISHIIDKSSAGEKDLKHLDNLFSLGYLGRKGGGSRGGSRSSGKSSSSRSSSRSSKPAARSGRSSVLSRIRSSASKAVSRAATLHSAAVRATTGRTKNQLTKIAQKAQKVRQSIIRKADQAKRAVSQRIKSKAGILRSDLAKKRDGILNRFKKGQITKPKAREQMQKLKAKGLLASRKLQAEKVKQIAPIVAFEAKKEEELADKQSELEKEVVDNAPPEDVIESGTEQEEPVHEEVSEGSFEPESSEESGEEETEAEEVFEPQEQEDEYDSEDNEDESEDLGKIKKSQIKKSPKKRGILLRARARPKSALTDKITKTATILGGLGIAAWFVKGIIEAKIKKGGE